MTTVSYVTTLFNKVPFLPYLLQGLAAQQGDFERQFIFVDDGSTDETVSVLRAMTEEWKNVHILQQKNSGPAIAMNTGLAAVEGDYVKALDGDDMLAPWATEYLLEALQKTGCQVAYGYRPSQGRYPVGPTFSFPTSAPPISVVREDNFLKKSLRASQTTPSSWLAETSSVKEAGGCDPRIFIQDYSLELRLGAKNRVVRIDNLVFFGPEDAPGRLSSNEAQTLHDCNLAVAYFLDDYPDLSPALVRHALRRISGRAWLWARRYGKKGYFSKEFFTHLAGRLGLLVPSPAIRETICAPFRETFPIRLID